MSPAMTHFARKLFAVEPIPLLAAQPSPRPPVVSAAWTLPLLAAAAAVALLAATHSGLRGDQEVALLTHLAESGNAGAQAQLGLAHRDGRYGLDADPHAGLDWLEAAAHGGEAYAADAVGDAYAEGRGTARDAAAAQRWWRQAAAEGNAHAAARLGQALLADGEIVEAREWLRKAADQGDAGAQTALRRLAREGQTGVADARRGVGTLAAAARRMDSPGLGLLAAVWDALGHGAPAGVRISRLEAQAQAGDPVAQYQLAERYSTGSWGVERDSTQALHWLRASAEAGNTVAMETLSKVYRDGRLGVSADPLFAQHWRARAQRTGVSADTAASN